MTFWSYKNVQSGGLSLKSYFRYLDLLSGNSQFYISLFFNLTWFELLKWLIKCNQIKSEVGLEYSKIK